MTMPSVPTHITNRDADAGGPQPRPGLRSAIISITSAVTVILVLTVIPDTLVPQTGRTVIAGLIAIIMGTWVLNIHGKAKADRWMYSSLLVGTDIKTNYDICEHSQLPHAILSRLEQQREEIRRRYTYHITVARDFSVNRYVTIGMSLLSSAVSITLLSFISVGGWRTADGWMHAAFVLSAVSAICLGAFPAIFVQKANGEQNMDLYLQHKSLEAELLTYIASWCSADLSTGRQSDVVSPVDFLQYLDKRMASLHQLPLGFDHKSVPREWLEEFDTRTRGSRTSRWPDRSARN